MEKNKIRILRNRDGKYVAHIPSSQVEISEHDVNFFRKERDRLLKEVKLQNGRIFLRDKKIGKLEQALKKFARNHAEKIGVLKSKT